MDTKKVGNRGILFTFHDLGISTNVYVINGNKFVYIIDTYLGPDIMKKVNDYIETQYRAKPTIIINTHSHWDHVWGNNFYPNSLIISHELCKEQMEQGGKRELEEYSEYKRGEVVLTYPNLTFTDKLYFVEDDVLIYHTPGHTADSISIIDIQDRVLFAGDNLEHPVPYIMSKNLKQFIHTLEAYLELDVEIIIGGHTGCEDKSLIQHNLDYIKKVLIGDTAEFESEEYLEYHKANIKWLSK